METYQNIKDGLPGFIEREAQTSMITTVEDSLRQGGIACVEGPCGTGKTLGYLVSVIPHALKTGKKVVLSTATVPLQEQIAGKDLPLLLKYGKLDFTFALAKGRSRYLCREKLQHAVAEGYHTEQTEGNLSLADLQHTVENGWEGDIDELDGVVDKWLWGRVRCDAHSCTRQQCVHYEQCGLIKAREKLKNADVIVTNHDMVFSDIKAGATILPQAQDTIYVFDEAHHLPAKGKNQFTYNFRIREIAPLLISFLQALDGYACDDEGYRQYHKTIRSHAKGCAKLASKIAGALETVSAGTFEHSSDDYVWRFKHGVLPLRLETAVQEMLNLFSALTSNSKAMLDHLRDNIRCTQETYADYSAFTSKVSKAVGAIERVAYTLKTLANAHKQNSIPRACWIERLLDHDNLDFRFVTAPIDVAAHLKRYLWDDCAGAVVTSATMTSFDSFDLFARSCGLQHTSKSVDYLMLPSPFNFEKQGTLIVPDMQYNPKQVEDHTAELTGMLPQMLSRDTGNLVLFASRKQMQAVYGGMPEAVKERVLMQGRLSKSEMLEQHRARVDKGVGSVIFGLISFAEGVDLPGRYCERVFIAKLPFGASVSPQEQATAEWITANGGDPFRQVTLHETITVLKQQVGRLIRTTTDSGIVCIFDTRLLTKGYGKFMLDALPPFSRPMDIPVKDVFTKVVPLAA